MFRRRPGVEPHPGRRALAHIERVLEQRPVKDDHELTFATQCLAAFREEMLERQRAGHPAAPASDRDRDCLSRVNAVISVVMGMHFPIGNPPWDEFEKTLGWLRDCIAEIEA